jgi:serine/threonine protein kinase
MAPEQFTGKNIDPRTDLFAFGASLYEMLAGHPPFEGIARDKPPRPIATINPTVPRLLARLIQISLEPDKSKRIQSAHDMLIPIKRVISRVNAVMAKSQGPTGTALRPFTPKDS